MPEVTTIRVILPIPVVTRITVGGVTHNVTAWGDITGTLSNQTDIQDALNLKEDLSNKSTDTSLGTSNTLYPTQNATKTYVDNAVSGGGVPSNRTLNIAGTTQDLSANRTWTQDEITGLGSTGIIKRTGANALAIATAQTDYWDTTDFAGPSTHGLVPDPGPSTPAALRVLGDDADWHAVAGGGVVSWGDLGGTLSDQTDLQSALDAKVPTTRTLTIGPTAQDLSSNRTWLGNVTDDAQTKAAIVPNTAPSGGQILVGNAGGTAYAKQTISGSGATISLASTGVATISGIADASLTNAQTYAAIVPNTAPSAGQILIGNAGNTAYAKNTVSGSGATVTLGATGVITISGIANASLTNSAITIAGTSTALGGSITLDTITGVSSNGLVKRTGANTLTNVTAPSGAVVGDSDTQTLTNKRNTARVTTITSSATPTINTDNCDCVTITALAAAINTMTTNLSGTPNNFDKLIFRIKDDGTARAITWGASFVAKGVALPTTTVISKLLTVGFIYDTVATSWGCVASAQEA